VNKKTPINMASPHFDSVDRQRIHQELDNILDGALSMGPNVKAFENAFAKRVGVRHAIAMNSCTSALEAVLSAHRVDGLEVIVPAQTFVATGMAVHLCGGIPIFAEINPENLCLSLQDVKKRITQKTAGIILVHMAGMITPEVNEFRKFCDEKNIFLIEDAAHAPGAQFNGCEAGSLGHAGCFSFYPSKVLTSGEGGMVTTNDDTIAEYVRSFQHRGRDMKSSEEEYIIPGRNVRMNEMSALLGLVQLGHLDDFLERRRTVADIYSQELKDFNYIKRIIPGNRISSSFWKYPILLSPGINRLAVAEILAKDQINVDWAYFPALHLQPVFKKLYKTSSGMLPLTEDLLNRHLCLPCHQRISDDEAYFVVQRLKKAINLITQSDLDV
jgi:perosamine synthetase